MFSAHRFFVCIQGIYVVTVIMWDDVKREKDRKALFELHRYKYQPHNEIRRPIFTHYTAQMRNIM